MRSRNVLITMAIIVFAAGIGWWIARPAAPPPGDDAVAGMIRETTRSDLSHESAQLAEAIAEQIDELAAAIETLTVAAEAESPAVDDTPAVLDEPTGPALLAGHAINIRTREPVPDLRVVLTRTGTLDDARNAPPRPPTGAANPAAVSGVTNESGVVHLRSDVTGVCRVEATTSAGATATGVGEFHSQGTTYLTLHLDDE